MRVLDGRSGDVLDERFGNVLDEGSGDGGSKAWRNFGRHVGGRFRTGSHIEKMNPLEFPQPVQAGEIDHLVGRDGSISDVRSRRGRAFVGDAYGLELVKSREETNQIFSLAPSALARHVRNVHTTGPH